MKSDVRVRFAPSPTGFFHIGGARTALFNWLYARHTGGTFVLRIEDTDQERGKDEYLQVILDGLKWLGMDWDEGPGKGGDYGPYLQSQRKDIYAKYLKVLQATGRVYEKDGALYFKVSGVHQEINDAIHGKVLRLEEKDFVIYRSDGTPVFHFVNVVDDIDMKITHVIRGEDHLSNTSKHVELFNAFGAEMPVFAHIPLILKSHGTGKMSKRETGALVEDYQKSHFIPEAVRNYLCLLGWSPKDDREILPIEEIVRLFDLCDVNDTNARFDEKKMSFVNSEYLRALPFEDFAKRAREVLKSCDFADEITDEKYLNSVMKISQEKLRSMNDLPSFIKYFFENNFEFEAEQREKLAKKTDVVARLTELKNTLERILEFSESNLEVAIAKLAEQNCVNTGDYIHSARFAVSGRGVGPSLYHMLVVLGKDSVLARIDRCIAKF